MSSPPSAGTPIRFDRKKYFPSDWNTGADRFCALFHRFGYIYKPMIEDSWLSAEKNWYLSDTEILKAIACAHRKFLGTRSGKASRYAVLDVDSNSEYHNINGINRIRQVLASAGINKTVPYQSSESGGWHLYIFFDEAISSRDLHKQLTNLLRLNEFDVQKGQLEIFPNPGESGSSGYGLRLPLQPGWGWLDHESMEIDFLRQELSAIAALDLFLFDFDNNSNTSHNFHQLKRCVADMLSRQDQDLPKAKPCKPERKSNVVSINATNVSLESVEAVHKIFGKVPPGINADVWFKGRRYFSEGLSGPSQRADAIFSIGHYLFYGDPELKSPALGYGCEEKRQYLLEEILSTKHNGLSEDLNSGRRDALLQIQRAAFWRPEAKEDLQPFSVPISWVLENKRRERDARSRIELAFQELRTSGRKFTATALRSIAKCSWETLYKHIDLWDPDSIKADDQLTAYEQISNDIFAISTDEYNAVLDSSNSSPGPSVSDLDSSVDLTNISEPPADILDFDSPLDWKNRLNLKGAEMVHSMFWKLSISSNIPVDFSVLELLEAERLLIFLLWRRESAPDYESELWINRFISKIRGVLARLRNGIVSNLNLTHFNGQ